MASRSPITPAQVAEIRKLVRTANSRIERAGAGQRSAMEYWVKQTTGGGKFSASTKGMSYGQANVYLKRLYDFLNAPSTTKRGWSELKAEGLRKASDTLNRGYKVDITDEELAEIVKQTGGEGSPEFYRAVNLVRARKARSGADWTGSSDQIGEAIAQKLTAQEALEEALRYRSARRSRSRRPRR